MCSARRVTSRSSSRFFSPDASRPLPGEQQPTPGALEIDLMTHSGLSAEAQHSCCNPAECIAVQQVHRNNLTCDWPL